MGWTQGRLMELRNGVRKQLFLFGFYPLPSNAIALSFLQTQSSHRQIISWWILGIKMIPSSDRTSPSIINEHFVFSFSSKLCFPYIEADLWLGASSRRKGHGFYFPCNGLTYLHTHPDSGSMTVTRAKHFLLNWRDCSSLCQVPSRTAGILN